MVRAKKWTWDTSIHRSELTENDFGKCVTGTRQCQPMFYDWARRIRSKGNKDPICNLPYRSNKLFCQSHELLMNLGNSASAEQPARGFFPLKLEETSWDKIAYKASYPKNVSCSRYSDSGGWNEMGSGGKKGRGEGTRRYLRPFSPYHPHPLHSMFFPSQNFFALPPISDRLEQATKDVFQSAWWRAKPRC